MRPTAGVAVCIYNGARYLQAQLDSIGFQTERPRQVVIVDDGSNDDSYELAQRWAAHAGIPTQVLRNDTNVGVVRNFEKASAMLRQDIVFFADQDDVWYPRKLAAMLDAFEASPALGLVHSDADLIDRDDAPLGRRLFDALLVTSQEKRAVADGHAYTVYARRNLVTGAACAVRARVLDSARPFSPSWLHDEWIAFVASLLGPVRLLDEPLMAYRLHEANTVGLPLTDLAWRIQSIAAAFVQPQRTRQAVRCRRLRELRERAVALDAIPSALATLDEAVAHALHRSTLSPQPLARLSAVRGEWASDRYRAWSAGRWSALRDLLRPN